MEDKQKIKDILNEPYGDDSFIYICEHDHMFTSIDRVKDKFGNEYSNPQKYVDGSIHLNDGNHIILCAITCEASEVFLHELEYKDGYTKIRKGSMYTIQSTTNVHEASISESVYYIDDFRIIVKNMSGNIISDSIENLITFSINKNDDHLCVVSIDNNPKNGTHYSRKLMLIENSDIKAVSYIDNEILSQLVIISYNTEIDKCEIDIMDIDECIPLDTDITLS